MALEFIKNSTAVRFPNKSSTGIQLTKVVGFMQKIRRTWKTKTTQSRGQIVAAGRTERAGRS